MEKYSKIRLEQGRTLTDVAAKSELTIGDDVLRLKVGDSLYFDSGMVHQIQIIGKRPDKFICIFIQDIPATQTRARETNVKC